MLINPDIVKAALKDLTITGAFHVGAHECEELGFYTGTLAIPPDNIVWVDALHSKVHEAIAKGIPHVYQAVMSDTDNATVTFHVSNNVQSSSILELGTHATEHPHVHYVTKLTLQTHTIDTFAKYNGLDMSKYNFWNLDIQGAELLALKGGKESLKHADALYLEVNEAELYKGCGLISEIDAFLSDAGFARTITHMLEHKWGDALYVRTRDATA